MKGRSGVCVCFWFISHNFLFDNTAERSHLDTIREEIPIIVAQEKEMYNNGFHLRHTCSDRASRWFGCIGLIWPDNQTEFPSCFHFIIRSNVVFVITGQE